MVDDYLHDQSPVLKVVRPTLQITCIFKTSNRIVSFNH